MTSYQCALVLLGLWFLTIPLIGLSLIFGKCQFDSRFRPNQRMTDFLLYINLTAWVLMWCFRFWGS